jgi:adenosylcobinamide-GDP ribazoletransferase
MDPRGLITAIRTLTAVPVGGKDAESFSDSLIWFPVVGLILGMLLWSVGNVWAGSLGPDWPGAGAVAVLFAQILLTRALHMDGFADWADGMGARDRSARLMIMKDPHLGSFGVIALVFDILAKWVALERLILSGGLMVIVPVSILSRTAMVSLMRRLPYARTGDGMGRPFFQDISPAKEWVALGIALCVCLWFGPLGIGLFAAGWIIGKVLELSFRRGLGGVTGDLLGASNEVVEILLLWLCACSAGLFPQVLGWAGVWR